MKIYTKTGDDGTTSLVGGQRVKKYSSRLDAYGSVDELSAHIAFLRDLIEESQGLDSTTMSEEMDELLTILKRLMVVSAMLATEKEFYDKIPKIKNEDIELLEQGIDRMDKEIKPIKFFTLPCGNKVLSSAHIARTVCRRAERATIKASEEFEIEPTPTIYLNRLSDYLYALGRVLTQRLDIQEIYWDGK